MFSIFRGVLLEVVLPEVRFLDGDIEELQTKECNLTQPAQCCFH